MNLAIDFGNTCTKLALFEKYELKQKFVLEKLTVNNLNVVLTNHSVKNIIYSSVVQLESELEGFFQRHQALVLTAATPLPFQNQYLTPETLGKDRLAAVAAATHLFPNQTTLIIDAGTCITYDWLIEGRNYIGGNIAPGLQMRLNAMHEFTDALPLVENHWNEQYVGDSTMTAMQNGALLGTLLEVEGIIEWSSSKWKEINVILTGGNTDFFANHLKKKIFASPELVLLGLNKILDHNARLEE
ncbi:MAG: type III pantothenate kinase [Bacteroidota bacterium]